MWVTKWANHNRPRRLPESKKGQRLEGRGILRKVSYDLFLLFPRYLLVVPVGERVLSQMDARTESIQSFLLSQTIYCLRLFRETNSGEDP